MFYVGSVVLPLEVTFFVVGSNIFFDLTVLCWLVDITFANVFDLDVRIKHFYGTVSSCRFRRAGFGLRQADSEKVF